MTKELIEEALRWANGHPNRRSSELMRALADALAAVPDAATELRRGVTEWAKRFIPGDRWDTEDLRDLESALNGNVEANPDRRRARSESTEAERDAALAAIERARAVCLHLGGVDGDVSQPAPSYYVSVGRNVVATEVLAALDGAPEPEVKP